MCILEFEVALMKHLNFRQNMIVSNVHWGLVLGGKPMHECDLLMLTRNNYATEIEIKTSKKDLVKDRQKTHGHNHDFIKYLYFAVPAYLVQFAYDEIPPRAGLYAIQKPKPGKSLSTVELIRHATTNPNTKQWTEKQKARLSRLAMMRLYTHKKVILRHQKEVKKYAKRLLKKESD